MSIPKEDLKYLTDKQRKSLKDKKMPESQALQWIAEQKHYEAIDDEAVKSLINHIKQNEELFKEMLLGDLEGKILALVAIAIEEGMVEVSRKGNKIKVEPPSLLEIYNICETTVSNLLNTRFTGRTVKESTSLGDKETLLDVLFVTAMDSEDVILQYLKDFEYQSDEENLDEVLAGIENDYVIDIKDEMFSDKMKELMDMSLIDYLSGESKKHVDKDIIEKTQELLCDLQKCVEFNKIIDNIVDDINLIQGNKIITIVGDYIKNGSIIFNFNKNINDSKLNGVLLGGLLGRAAMIVREFTDNMIGEAPIKNIYGMIINDGEYRWLKEEEVFEAMNTDNKTGELLEPDTTLNYCGFYFKK